MPGAAILAPRTSGGHQTATEKFFLAIESVSGGRQRAECQNTVGAPPGLRAAVGPRAVPGTQ